MLTKEKLIEMTERKLKKATLAYDRNSHKYGVKPEERNNLFNNYQYYQTVLELLRGDDND